MHAAHSPQPTAQGPQPTAHSPQPRAPWPTSLTLSHLSQPLAATPTSEFPPLVKLETLLLTFLEVPQNAERCRQQRIDEARQVLRATARSADEQGFSDSESDGLSDTDSDCSRVS